MTMEVHASSGLSKATWTDVDFEIMGWHDCRVHAISVGEYEDDTLPPRMSRLSWNLGDDPI